ncbi:MAG: M16 family metallopeptidase [Pyrinomonadaceae bacterium]
MRNHNLFKNIVFVTVIASVLTFAGPAYTQTAPKQEKLLNGLKVLMWSDANADKVMVKIRIHAGSAFDPQGKEGVMQLLADNIFPNAASREFFAEDLGGNLEIVTTFDYIQINASSKPEEFLTMLETLSSAVSNPTIDKETTTKLRNALLAKVKALESDPAYVADQAAANRLLGTFPYGRPQMGTSESVQRINFPDLIDAKQRFLSADNATVAISGNFDRSLGFKAIRRYFGGWLKSDKRVPSTFKQPDLPPPGVFNVSSPLPDVAAIRFAIRGIARNDKNLVAAMIFTFVLENRLKARIPASLTNDVFVHNEARTLPGVILIGFSGGKNEIGSGNGKIVGSDLVASAISDAVTEAEFQTAKNAFQTAWSAKDAATIWLDADTFKTAGADADAKIAANVTLNDVRAYAEKLKIQPMVSVLVKSPSDK